MPGWHEQIKDLYESGELQVVGIIQEQHPDRCRLFMQWKQMDWPILVDSLNLLEMSAVPVTVAIDEQGIVREKRLRMDRAEDFRAGFMKMEFPAVESDSVSGSDGAEEPPTGWPVAVKPTDGSDAQAWRNFGDLIVRSNAVGRIDEAIAAYEQAVEMEPEDGWTEFLLGVALRMRYDLGERRDGDFQAAVDHWKAALDIDPNQYIWRRRIQQYGPRLDKPYPFYDWVPRAREEISARGETPPALVVEPGGAEFAEPLKELSQVEGIVEPPDAGGRIHRDEGAFVALETVVVPGSIRPGEATRFHVNFAPREEIKAHWNNEVDGLEVWLEEPEDCEVDGPHRQLMNPPEVVSLEERKVEYEIHCGDDVAAGSRTLNGYALYYVCEDVNGTCLYRRQDFVSSIEVREQEDTRPRAAAGTACRAPTFRLSVSRLE